MTTASNLTAFWAETQRQKKQKKTKKTKKTKNKTIITHYQMKAPQEAQRLKSYKLLV
jgi:ribosomal 30S subunit maturation factor RimM